MKLIVVMIFFCLWFHRRQQYVGKVRFSHFDTHMQSSKKVLLATESNVFAALNTRTGDLCEYFFKLWYVHVSWYVLLYYEYLFCLFLLKSGDMWIRLVQRETLMPFCIMAKVLFFWHCIWTSRFLVASLRAYNLPINFYCLDAVLVVGNGRVLRSWDISVGGLNWEIVLDSGRWIPWWMEWLGVNCLYIIYLLTAVVLYFSFQSACLIGQQGTVKHAAVLKKSVISLHYLSNGHQKWIENLPERYTAMFFILCIIWSTIRYFFSKLFSIKSKNTLK